MRVNRTYCIDSNTVQDLNDTIQRNSRSRFVDEAIKTKLSGATDTSLVDIPSRRLLAVLLNREDVTDFLKKCIKAELIE